MAIKLGVKDGQDFMASWPTYQGELKVINEEKRTIEFVFSDETIDRDKEIIKVSGWDIKNYKKNPVVQWAHNHCGLPVGRSEKTWADTALRGRVLFTSEDTGNSMGEAVFNLYINKFLNCGSVGFIGLEDKWAEDTEKEPKVRRTFLRQELLEYSCCPVPANPGASVVRDFSEFDSTDIRKEIGWMRNKGIVDDMAEKFLLGAYDFLEGRKTLYYPVHQCKHENCEEAKEKGECVYGKEQKEEEKQEQRSGETEGQKEEEIDITNQEGLDKLLINIQKEEKQFEIQTLIFPKDKWDNVAAVKAWAKENDFRTDKVDETDSSWRLRQADPNDFTRLRTICINPGRTTPMGDCKVKAVGGPKKVFDEYDNEQNLIDLLLEEAVEIVRSQDGSWVEVLTEEKENKDQHRSIGCMNVAAVKVWASEEKDQHGAINCMMEAIGYMDKARGSMMDAMMALPLNMEEEETILIQGLVGKIGAVLNSKNKLRIKEAIKNLEGVLKDAGEEEEENLIVEEEKELGLEEIEDLVLLEEDDEEVDWEEVFDLIAEEENVN